MIRKFWRFIFAWIACPFLFIVVFPTGFIMQYLFDGMDNLEIKEMFLEWWKWAACL